MSLTEPHLTTATDAEWRAHYEAKCREQRKDIAKHRDAMIGMRGVLTLIMDIAREEFQEGTYTERQEKLWKSILEMTDAALGQPSVNDLERYKREFFDQGARRP